MYNSISHNSEVNKMANKIKVIMDCDVGHDDAVALMVAAADPMIELLGITVVSGNQTL